MKTRLSPFEHSIFKELSAHSGRLLVAVSGGLDSIALLHVVNEMKGRLQAEIFVGHVHHGSSEARDQMQVFVKNECSELGLNFVTNTPTENPSFEENEEGWRRLRHHWFEKWREELQVDFILLAHHWDDLLETRLIRLIRGTGARGLEGMVSDDGFFVRPFLKVSRVKLEEYVSENKLSFFEDPSNNEKRWLRNWIRRDWLPQLEAYRPGATEALGRSLELVVQSVRENEPGESLGASLDRAELLRKTPEKQSQTLANYLYSLGLKSYRRSQIEEVLKRLKTSQKEVEFSVAGCHWRLTARQVTALPKVDGDSRRLS